MGRINRLDLVIALRPPSTSPLLPSSSSMLFVLSRDGRDDHSKDYSHLSLSLPNPYLFSHAAISHCSIRTHDAANNGKHTRIWCALPACGSVAIVHSEDLFGKFVEVIAL